MYCRCVVGVLSVRSRIVSVCSVSVVGELSGVLSLFSQLAVGYILVSYWCIILLLHPCKLRTRDVAGCSKRTRRGTA